MVNLTLRADCIDEDDVAGLFVLLDVRAAAVTDPGTVRIAVESFPGLNQRISFVGSACVR
jgi:hypothetical protein